MLNIAKINGFCDFCIPYNDNHEVLLGTLKELIDGE